jgi:predicted secreted protein
MQARKLADLQPADLDKMIANSQEALVDLNYLRELCTSLDRIYKSAAEGL